jgi:hypothetical protein
VTARVVDFFSVAHRGVRCKDEKSLTGNWTVKSKEHEIPFAKQLDTAGAVENSERLVSGLQCTADEGLGLRCESDQEQMSHNLQIYGYVDKITNVI